MKLETWQRLNKSRRMETALLCGLIVLIAVIGISGWRSASKLTQFVNAADSDQYYKMLVRDLQTVIGDLTTAPDAQRGHEATRTHTLFRGADSLGEAIQQRLKDVQAEYETGSTQTRGRFLALRQDTIQAFLVTAMLAAGVLVFVSSIVLMEARFVRDLSNQLLRESRHDSLTGLPNRAYLNDSLARSLMGAKRVGGKLGLLYIDLNGFKTINDTLGHSVGDEVLIDAARWFETAARGSDFVARLGGDEFAVVLPGAASRAQVAAAAERFGKLSISRGPHVVNASVGYAVFPEDGLTAEELTRLSDAAMYERKQQSKRQGA